MKRRLFAQGLLDIINGMAPQTGVIHLFMYMYD